MIDPIQPPREQPAISGKGTRSGTKQAESGKIVPERGEFPPRAHIREEKFKVNVNRKEYPAERLRVYVKPRPGTKEYLSLTEHQSAVAEAKEDAERWRTLLKCERIRILGSGGLGTQAQHLGLEIWDKYPGEHPDGTNDLTRFVDTIRARPSQGPEGSAE